MKHLKFIFLFIVVFFVTIPAYCQNTQGFFLSNTHSKTLVVPSYRKISRIDRPTDVTIHVDFGDTIATVSKYIYGNNSNVYMSQMVNQPELIRYIKQLSPKVIRFPGGNLSNLYFWNAKPGEKPSDVPDTILYGDKRKIKKSRFWYGMNNNPHTMSVDHYYQMLKMTGSTGIICVNNGYARFGTGPHPVQTAAHLAAEWVRYDNGRTKFWEIGNEDYGPWEAGYVIDTTKNRDGQPRITNGALYGKHFKVFADSMRVAARQIGTTIKIGAVLEELPKKRPVMSDWNRKFFKTAGNEADFFIIHSYYTPYNQDSPPSIILNSAQKESTKMMNYMKKMSRNLGIQQKPVALTEWNIFATGSKQDCSYISGIHAALVLGSLIKNKYGLACRWDLANGYNHGNDMGMFNKGDEPGVPKWNPRPVYFYMYYFQKYFGDHMVRSAASDTNIVAYASRFHNGGTGMVIINKSPGSKGIRIKLNRENTGKRYYMYRLTGGKDNAPFSQKVFINGVAPDYATGGPIKEMKHIRALSSRINNGSIEIKSPGYSVEYVFCKR